MRYFSAFAGIGGIDKGIRGVWPDAKCTGFSEVDKHAIRVYKKHYPNTVNCGDIRGIRAEDIQDFDMFCGGFPCQDVSRIGKRAGLKGSRSGLFFDAVKVIETKKPRVIFFENVKGLLSSNRGWDFATVLLALDELGYDVEWACLDSECFGVPQRRQRVYIIGHLRTQPWTPVFPIGKGHSVYQETDGGCGDFREWFWGGDSCSTLTANYKRGVHCGGETYIQTRPVITPDNYIPVYDDEGELEAVICPHCLDEFGNCNCLGVSSEFEDGEYRRLTPLECERLQGFPDNWTDILSDTQRYNCLGNAVTVPVIKVIIKRIKENF